MKTETLVTYKSYEAVVDRALNGPCLLTGRTSRGTGGGCDEEWFGGSWAMAERIAPIGDMDGASELAPAVIEGANEMLLQASRYDPVYNVEGGRWVDVGRFCAGEPECFVDMVENHQAIKRGVTIVFNACVNSHGDPKAMNKVGIAVGQTVLGLQASGYAVSVIMAYKNEGYEDIRIEYFPLTGENMTFDIAKLSAVIRPWFFRRIMFGVWETYDLKHMDDHGVTLSGGGSYGCSVSMDKKDALKIVKGNSTIIVINLGDYVKNPSGVQSEILKAIKKGE